MDLLQIKIYLANHGITKWIYQWKEERKEKKIRAMSDEEYAMADKETLLMGVPSGKKK